MWSTMNNFAQSLGRDFAGGSTSFLREYFCFSSNFAFKPDLDRGNKILLPSSALNVLAQMDVQWPMLFELSNLETGRKTHCGVLEFSADEGRCYAPYWMMSHLLLREGDKVSVKNVSLPKGSYVKLQPMTSDFLDISNPRAVLEETLRHFACLSVADNIVIQYNEKFYEIEILECKPADAISIVEVDVQVDFAPPKDYVEPSPPAQLLPQEVETIVTDATPEIEAASRFQLFGGSGARLDGRAAMDQLATSDFPTSNSENPPQDARTAPTTPRKILRGGVRTSNPKFEELFLNNRVRQYVPKEKKSVPIFTGPGKRLD